VITWQIIFKEINILEGNKLAIFKIFESVTFSFIYPLSEYSNFLFCTYLETWAYPRESKTYKWDTSDLQPVHALSGTTSYNPIVGEKTPNMNSIGKYFSPVMQANICSI